jgi:hypothetical protein
MLLLLPFDDGCCSSLSSCASVALLCWTLQLKRCRIAGCAECGGYALRE